MKSLMMTTLATLALLASASSHAFGNLPPECLMALIHHVECIPGMTYNGNFSHGTVVPLPVPDLTMPDQGSSIETVHAQYPVVMNWKFETLSVAALNAQMALIQDVELARMSTEYGLATNGNISVLVDVAASKLTAGNLARLRTAFGPAVDTAVQAYAPPDVAAQYFAWLASTGGPMLPQSHAQHMAQGLMAQTTNGATGGTAAPNDSMTMQEIYNEYLFTESETQMGAFSKMVWFVAKRLSWPVTRGYAAGTAFYAFATTLNPDYGPLLVEEYGIINSLDFGVVDGSVTGVVIVGEPYTDPSIDVSYWEFSDPFGMWCLPLGC